MPGSTIAKLISIIILCLINTAVYLTLWRSYIRPKCILPYQDPNYQAADHNVFKPTNLRFQLLIFMLGFIGAPIFILLGWLKVPGPHCFLFQLCFLTNAALYPLLLLQCMWSYRLYYRLLYMRGNFYLKVSAFQIFTLVPFLLAFGYFNYQWVWIIQASQLAYNGKNDSTTGNANGFCFEYLDNNGTETTLQYAIPIKGYVWGSLGAEVFNMLLIVIFTINSYKEMKKIGYDMDALDGIGVMVKLVTAQIIHLIKWAALADPLIRLKWIDVVLIYLVFVPIDTQMIFLPDSKWSRMVRNYVRQKLTAFANQVDLPMAPPNPSKVSTENEKTVKVETQGKEAAKGSAPPNPAEVRASKASREVEVQGAQGQRVWDDDELASKAVKVFKEELAEMNRSGLPKIEDMVRPKIIEPTELRVVTKNPSDKAPLGANYRINNSVYKGNKVFLVSQEDGYSLKVSDMDAGVFGAFKEAYTTKICENKYFLKLFGITYTPDMNPVFIYGGRAKGSLLDVLRNKHQEVTYRLALKWLNQLLDCAYLLAKENIVYREFISANIIIDSNEDVRIGSIYDYRNISDEAKIKMHDLTREDGLEIMRCFAPETLRDETKFTKESLMWQFGILYWEILTRGHVPYDQLQVSELAVNIEKGVRCRQPLECDLTLYKVMLACWHPDPMQRPILKHIIDFMKQYEIELTTREASMFIKKYSNKRACEIVQSVDAAKLGLELGYIDQEYFTNLKCLAQEIADKFNIDNEETLGFEMEKYDWPNWALEVNSERVHVPIDIRKMEDPAKIQPLPRISHQKKYNLKMLMNQ